MALTIDELNIQIASDSSKATRALTSLIKKLEKLKASLNGTNVSNITITNSFNKTTNSVKKADTAVTKYNTTSKTASKSTASFTDKLAMNISKWRTLFGVFQNAADIMGSWFKESNNYIETLNLFNVTMGDTADKASEFAESVQELMGIDIAEWMNYQGTFKQLTSGFGVASDSANVMSQNLTQLSYDMASFFNTDVETAFDKLSSAMAGQVKGLRDFGIDVTVASLQEYALAEGIDKTVRSMTQAEKSLLRYNYIMEKSINMQGDMARTIITPANALRILDAQLTQLKRALGNIVSALVVNVIPYVQAFVKLITEAAQSLALFFGFKVQEIDYSGLGSGFVDEMEDAEESLEGSSDTLKKIKKQLMGFDELNILNNPDTDSAAGSAGADGGGVLDVEPLEYDFLKGLDTSKAEKIYNTVKKMLAPLKKIWEYLNDYGDTIGTIIGIITAFGIINWLKKIKTSLAGLKLAEYFLTGFRSAKALGGTFFQSFSAGIDGIRNSLTWMQKAAIVAVAGIIEFVAVKDSVKALALGCEDVGAKIVTIGVVAAAAATAMYIALGPTGIAIAALVSLAGAIAGVSEANAEMRRLLVEEAFYNGVGTSITNLAATFTGLMEAIESTNEPIITNKAKIEEAKKSIESTIFSIELLSTKYASDLIPKDEYISQVTEKFNQLKTDVSTTMDLIYQNVIYALSTSLGDAVEQAGGSVEEYMKLIGKIKQEGDTLYTSLVEQQEKLNVQFANGEISSDEYATGLMDVNDKLAALSGQTTAVQEFSDKVEGLKNSVNWENEDARKNAFETIQNSAMGAKESINESCDEIKRNLETMKLWTTDQEALLAIDKLLLGNEESRAKQMAGVDEAVNSIYNKLQTDLITKTNEVAAAAKKEWDSMGGWARFWSGEKSEAEYVSAALDTYQKDFVNPISKEIQDSIDYLGTKGKTWASNAMTGVLQKAFDFQLNRDGSHIISYAEDLSTAVTSALKGAGEDAVLGYIQGVDSKKIPLTKSWESSVLAGLDAAKKAQDSNSPSKKFMSLAKDAVDGYVKGVEGNFHSITDAFKEGFKSAFESLTKQASSIFSVDKWTGYARNITTALSSVRMPRFSNIGLSVSLDTWVSSDKEKVYKALGLSGWPRLSWYTYAQGGFPTMGEMFIAREEGPELVGSIGRKTAVANNDQIIDGIYNGVYRAMMAANNGKNGGNITVNATLELDGEVVGKKVIKYHNGVVMQTGESPLLV